MRGASLGNDMDHGVGIRDIAKGREVIIDVAGGVF